MYAVLNTDRQLKQISFIDFSLFSSLFSRFEKHVTKYVLLSDRCMRDQVSPAILVLQGVQFCDFLFAFQGN